MFLNFKKETIHILIVFFNQVDWISYLSNEDLNANVTVFYQILHYSISCFIPVEHRRYDNYPVWFSKELKSLIAKKKFFHSKFKYFRSQELYSKFSELRSVCKELAQECYAVHMEKVQFDLTLSPKSFWKNCNNKNKKNPIPSTLQYLNEESSCDFSSAALFNKYFSSVFETDDNSNLPEVSEEGKIDLNNIPDVSRSVIFDSITKLNDDSSFGPDGIPNFFLKQCVYSLTYPLWILFKQSIDTAIYPDYWKINFVTPLLKTPPINEISNYRPIAKISSIPKLFESIIMNLIGDTLSTALHNNQHGFRKRKSTVTNLVEFTSMVSNAMENGNQVDVVYLDLAKAFDKVNHRILIHLLQSFGIGEPLLSWFSSYLTNRKQRVKINDAISPDATVFSGVPQGSHFGPILFNIFINNLPIIIKHSKILLFADDAKIFREIKSIEDCISLQEDVNEMVSWLTRHKLKLNCNKCSFISLSRSQNKINFDYQINNAPLSRVTTQKDLGIIVDTKLSFNEHINCMVKKANKCLYLISRNNYFTVNTLRRLYCALVRPILEYGSTCWNPYTKNQIDRIQSVQNRFLRLCAYKLNIRHSNINYQDISSMLHIVPLEDRRSHIDFLFLFKILNGEIDSDYILGNINFHVPVVNLRNNYLFETNYHRTNYGKFGVLNRLMQAGNKFKQIDIFNTKKKLKLRDIH